MADWNPQAYLAFADERLRPAQDLLARVPPGERQVIFDLGSGPGNSTALLRSAYPEAAVTGIESSPAMVARARQALPGAEFIEADVTTFIPPPETDLLYSNALFQWLPTHLDLWKAYLAALRPGAVLAVQMPDNLDEPSHALMREVAALPPFRERLAGRNTVRARILSPAAYHDHLSPLCAQVEIWRTTYNHVVSGIAGIADFYSTTGLKPYLDPLTEEERRQFRAAYEQRLAAAYPLLRDGRAMFALPRLFIVAMR